MIVDHTGKKVLVISDHSGLFRAIEWNLSKCLGAEVVKVALGSPAKNGHLDLIVLAMSSPTSEPLVALAKASLSGRIGQVPILIISDRLFKCAPEVRIFRLDFPFAAEGLCNMVSKLLQATR